MDITDILALPPSDIVKTLMIRNNNAPKIEELEKVYDVSKHDIMTNTNRTKYDKESGTKIEMARIGIPFQKLIVNRAASFSFGKPVKLITQGLTAGQENIFKQLKKWWTDTFMDTRVKEMARILLSEQEVSAIITIEPETNKLRCTVLSQFGGLNKIYPVVNEYNELEVFSRYFSITKYNEVKYYFEVITKDVFIRFVKSGDWVQESKVTLSYGFIPVIYAIMPEHFTKSVDHINKQQELRISDFCDSNGYFASPVLVTEGQVEGNLTKKDATGRMISMEKGGSVKILTADNAPAAVKEELDRLSQLMFSMLQMPDIDFNNLKSSNIKTVDALTMAFLDAYMKVSDLSEYYYMFLNPLVNIIKTYIGYLNGNISELATLSIYPEITPYMLNDEAAIITNMIAATGGKPLLSMQTAISNSGLVDDVNAEMALIEAENKQSQTNMLINNQTY